MSRVSLHLRLTHTFKKMVEKAIRYNLSLFQCFFLYAGNNKHIQLTQQEIDEFVSSFSSKFTHLFVHGSYWINLARSNRGSFKALELELSLAQKLGFTHMVLHPGSIQHMQNKSDGIANLAHALNTIMKQEKDIRIVLENTAHGGLSIGSDIKDFGLLLDQLERPEQVDFCLDTSHAYAYGYDISSTQGQVDFLGLVDKHIGLEKIVLIHLNDTKQVLGSRIDRHAILGEGNIGLDALEQFVQHDELQHVPLLLELPPVAEHVEQKLLRVIKDW